jgi:hypothetical protein
MILDDFCSSSITFYVLRGTSSHKDYRDKTRLYRSSLLKAKPTAPVLS